MASSSAVSAPELQQVVGHLDQALRVFQRYEGRLSAADIRLRSMLRVIRTEIEDELLTLGQPPTRPAADTED